VVLGTLRLISIILEF